MQFNLSLFCFQASTMAERRPLLSRKWLSFFRNWWKACSISHFWHDDITNKTVYGLSSKIMRWPLIRTHGQMNTGKQVSITRVFDHEMPSYLIIGWILGPIRTLRWSPCGQFRFLAVNSILFFNWKTWDSYMFALLCIAMSAFSNGLRTITIGFDLPQSS